MIMMMIRSSIKNSIFNNGIISESSDSDSTSGSSTGNSCMIINGITVCINNRAIISTKNSTTTTKL